MSTVTPMSDAELEQRIARERELAEAAMARASRCSNPVERRGWENRARGHYQMMSGLISKRSDARVESMERERGLR